ncbi:hypothetical protein C8C83_4325 [Flavobacterium sp. 90]|nr:hypothetical protein C8C82_4662 [Flavobacterium sp. 81]TCK56312.1 hypothetical protein C8C83_4325 [Flavobacterium sp. 90]
MNSIMRIVNLAAEKFIELLAVLPKRWIGS